MHIRFVKYLADPVTQEPLSLTIEEQNGDIVRTGWLDSTANRYPIVRGIPRFVDFERENYSQNFSYQWKRWPRTQFESENAGGPMEGQTRRFWERVCETRESSFTRETLVLDVGCGPGRFIEVARSKGASVIGIDNSAAVEVAAQNHAGDQDVCICHGDALKLPLATAVVDGAFSIGVLHHTPDPALGVAEIARVLKDGGWCGVCVYGKGGYYDFPTVQMWRKLFQLTWPAFGHVPPLVYSYTVVSVFRRFVLTFPRLGKLVRLPFPLKAYPDFDWSVLDTFDSVTPSYQDGYDLETILRWLSRAGLQNVQQSTWNRASAHGRKPVRVTERDHVHSPATGHETDDVAHPE